MATNMAMVTGMAMALAVAAAAMAKAMAEGVGIVVVAAANVQWLPSLMVSQRAVGGNTGAVADSLRSPSSMMSKCAVGGDTGANHGRLLPAMSGGEGEGQQGHCLIEGERGEEKDGQSGKSLLSQALALGLGAIKRLATRTMYL